MNRINKNTFVKVFVAAVMALTLAFGLSACGVTISTDDDKNKENTQQNSQQNNSTQQSAPATNQQNTNAKISMDEAKAIATKDAGYDVSSVTFSKQELDYDDGIEKYEIEFVVGTTKFEYDVDANSGQILKRERESIYDD